MEKKRKNRSYTSSIKKNNKNKIKLLIDEIEQKNNIIKQLEKTIKNYEEQFKINAKELNNGLV